MPGRGGGQWVSDYLRVLQRPLDEFSHILQNALNASQVAVAHVPRLCTHTTLTPPAHHELTMPARSHMPWLCTHVTLSTEPYILSPTCHEALRHRSQPLTSSAWKLDASQIAHALSASPGSVQHELADADNGLSTGASRALTGCSQ